LDKVIFFFFFFFFFPSFSFCSCSPKDKVSDVLVAASQRWGAITGRDRLAVWVKLEGAKLHKDDVVALFASDKDELLVGFSDVVVAAARPAQDDLELALSVFFDENLFEGGRAKTVAELEEFQGLPGGEDEEDDDEEDDDAKAVCLAVAMYNFLPEEPDEIGFSVGDKMVVYRKREDGWWRGRHLDGPNKLVGYFPGNRVKVVHEGPDFLKPSPPPPPPPAVAVAVAASGVAVAEAASPRKRETVTVTMETESVCVQTAPGHGSPEMLRIVLDKEETKVVVSKVSC
jgi:hypothetical protein